MSVENLAIEYPFVGYLNCKARNNCSLNLGERGPCWLAVNGALLTAKNPRELTGKVEWYEKRAPCDKKGGTRCEEVEDGQVVRGKSVKLEWEEVRLLKKLKLSQEELF